MAMGFGVMFFLLGFILGTRGKQILATLKVMHKALLSTFSIKIPPTAEEDGKDDGDENDMQGEDEANTEGIDDFLSTDANPAMDDHPEVEINPVLMYLVRKAKDRQREERKLKAISEMRDKLVAEGYSEDEIVAKLAEDASMGEGGLPVRQNALAVLISVGARVEASAASGSADAQALKDKRRQQKNIDVYLATTQGVETAKTTAPTKNAKGARLESAYEVSKRTGVDRFGGGGYLRHVSQPQFAKTARNTFRDWKVRSQEYEKWASEETEEDQEGHDELDAAQKGRRGGGMVNNDDLALLRAEFAENEEAAGEEEEDGP